MIEKINTINWGKLKDNLGNSGENVGECLRKLVYEDNYGRNEAIHALVMILAPYDVVSEVTLHAVPILIELLKIEEREDRNHILDLLFNCFFCSEESPQFLSMKERIQANRSLTQQDYSVERLEMELKVGQIISQEIDLYISLFDSTDWLVRNAVFRLIGLGPFPKHMWEKIDAKYEYYKAKEKHPKIIDYLQEIDRVRTSGVYRLQWKI